VRSLRWWVWGGLAALIAAIAVVVFLPKSAPPPPPGIPLALAEERARRVSALEYDLSLAIPGNRAKPIDGRVVATFQLADTDGPLAFDFAQPADRVRGVRANNADVQAEIANGHVVIPRRALVKGANTVEIAFMAGDEALNRQDEFLYSLFVPARASLAMPVFDQPDLKAKWRLSLTLPPDWIAVSNAPQTGRAAASGTSRSRPASSRSRRPIGRAGRSACSTARRTRPRSRATATRSSTCMLARSSGSRRTPISPIRSASSISC
jgi:aminopeptidase N